MAQRWCTKADVLKDLEVASGCRVADVDDGYFLYGEQPPPPRAINNEDDEIELRFGRRASQGPGQGNEPGPDLIGITNMLRMVQKYENSSDEEAPVTPNKRIIISKANSIKVASPAKTRLGLKDKDNHVSPNKMVVSDRSKAQSSGDMALNGALGQSDKENGDKIASSSRIDVRKLASPSKTNGGGDNIWTNNGLASNKLPSHAKIITSNGTIISHLNPYVKEFIPKNAQSASLQNCTSTKENFDGTRVTDTQNNYIDGPSRNKKSGNKIDNLEIDVPSCNKKSENEIDNLEIIKDDTAVKGIDSSKEIKNQMAMMLKKQISAKNDTFEDKQQTNRAIVNLLKLYADPKPAKPLKLLTPQFFETCKATASKDNIEESNKTDCSIERMALLHDLKEVNVHVTPSTPRGSMSERKEDTPLALGSENSETEMATNVKLYKERDAERKNNDISLSRNVLVKNNFTLKEDNKQAGFLYDEHITEEFKVNKAIHKENNDIEEFNEVEATQLTPDIGDINIDESNVLPETVRIDPYMEESISKVSNWLYDKPVVTVTEKSKSPMLYLGAVAYKRKDPVTCKSPSEVTGKKIPKATEYKPSSYAEELHKKYSEKSKTKTPTPTLNIWEKLEADLKKKDLDVKSRQKKA